MDQKSIPPPHPGTISAHFLAKPVPTFAENADLAGDGALYLLKRARMDQKSIPHRPRLSPGAGFKGLVGLD